MALTEQTLLGIQLGEHEIRVLELKSRSGRTWISKVASAATPIGSIVQGEVANATNVEFTVKRLLEQISASNGARAVIGIPSGGSALQTISVPAAPDSELPAIVAGEVEHYNIVKGTGGSHAFVKLATAIKSDAPQPVLVTVIGAERQTIHAIQSVADACGLNLVAIEPSEYGMLRTTITSRATNGDAILVMVTDHAADIAFVHDGKPHFYRRTELSAKVLARPVAAASVGDARVIEEGPIHKPAGDQIVSELLRTVEYVEREFAPMYQIGQVFIAVDSVEMEPVAEFIRDRIPLPVALIRAPAGEAATKEISERMLAADGLRYTSAYGLAARILPSMAKVIPNLDLFARERVRVAHQYERRKIYASGAISLLSLALGFTGHLMFKNQSVEVERRIDGIHRQVAGLTSTATLTVEARNRAAEQYRLLSREGVPVGYLLDSIALSLYPGLGIREVSIDNSLSVGISGEALREPEMISMVEALQKSPLLSDVHVRSFGRVGPRGSQGLKFEIAAITVAGDRIRHPKDKAEALK